MKEKYWYLTKVLFHVVCWISAISLVLYWIYLFTLNEDTSVVDYQKYYHRKEDKHPMISLCLRDPFNNTQLEMLSGKFNATSYLEFIEGNYFSKDLLTYDYHKLKVNILEYVISYWSNWKNESYKTYDPNEYSSNGLTSTFAGFWRDRFYNCYGLQMPEDQNLQGQAVHLKSDIFKSNIRPTAFGFITLLHYPNQLSRSFRTIRMSWAQRKTSETYGMTFLINAVEMMIHRNKNEFPCNEKGEDYDKILQIHHSKSVGCRAPYLNPSIDTKPCSTLQEMKNSRFFLRNDDYGTIPPCRTMEKISHTYREQEYANT